MVEQIIMRSGSHSLNGFNFDHIVPVSGLDFSSQVKSCVDQLQEFIHHEGNQAYYVTQQTFFIHADSREQYDERAGEIRRHLHQAGGMNQPATSIVAQSPVSGNDVVLELICIPADTDREVIYKSWAGINYTVVEYNGYKAVHCAGLTGEPQDTISACSHRAFKTGMHILSLEGLSIDNIVRQWNYIEKITAVTEGGESQNYQIFNDIRANYYDMGHFDSGFPAATGIGMDTGGVIISFIALSDAEDLILKPIRNPGQIDAHSYSEGVLQGSESMKCTPKFERAKMISTGGRHYFYVSGTASILGEKTVHAGDVAKQTRTTIDNIRRLFSRENQASLGLSFDVSAILFSHLRVYVKHQEDVEVVRQICEENLNCKSSLFLKSDVCREDLLVEIEGVFSITES